MNLSPLLLSLSLYFLSFTKLLLVNSSTLKPSCNFPAIFNLGDSNSDTGGLSSAFSIGPVNLPYGETFFNMPAGRFSDGRLLIDFIAERLGLPYVEAYLDALGGNFSHGVNFATALSTILDENSTLPLGAYSPFSLGVQLKQFLLFKTRSQLIYNQGGIKKYYVPREEYFSNALYTIDIGQNDLTAYAFSSNGSADNYLRNVLSQFSTVLKDIYKAGGRYFWIHNTGPLGCLGYVLIHGPKDLDQAGCSLSYNKLAQQFNTIIKETIMQLRNELPNASLTLVDIYSIKYQLISNATKYGFENPLEACCGSGGNKYNYDPKARCGYTITIKGVDILLGKSCKKPQKSIIWDGIHYTEEANKWVFEQISTGKFSDPPLDLSHACYNI